MNVRFAKFIFILFALTLVLSCTVDKAEMRTSIKTEVLSFHDNTNVISVRYEIMGVTFLSDIEINSAALYEVVKRGITKDNKLELTILTKLHTDNDRSDYSSMTFFFGPSELSELKVDGEVITHIAKMNPEQFVWEFKDGEEVENQEAVEESPKKEETSVGEVKPFEEGNKL